MIRPIDQLCVHVVTKDKEIFLLRYLIDRVQRLGGIDRAGRIVGRIEEDCFAFCGDMLRQILRGDLEMICAGIHRDIYAAG